MKKIRFEINIDEVIEFQCSIPCSHDCFKGEKVMEESLSHS